MRAINFIILVCMHGFECTIVITAEIPRKHFSYSHSLTFAPLHVISRYGYKSLNRERYDTNHHITKSIKNKHIKFLLSIRCPSQIIVQTGPRAIVVYEGIGVALCAITTRMAFVREVAKQFMHLAEILALTRRCILYDCAPAIRIR